MHTFDDFELGFETFRLFDGDDAIFADFRHGSRQNFTNRAVGIGRNRSDLFDFLLRLRRTSQFLEFCDDGFDRFIDAAFDAHRALACDDEFHAFAEDGLRQNSRRRRAVAGNVVRLRRHFAHHLRPHVLEFVFELDFFGNRDAIFRNERCSISLLDDDVAPLRTQRNFDRVGNLIHATEDFFTRLFVKNNFFCSHISTPLTI